MEHHALSRTGEAAKNPDALFSALMKRTWQEFAARFWALLGLQVFFGAIIFFLQFLFFGSTALKVLGESFKSGNVAGFSSSGLYALIQLSDAALAVAIPAIILALTFEVLHQSALFSLVAHPTVGRRRFRVSLREGAYIAWKIAILIIMLIAGVAIINALLSLLARAVFHYTGNLQEGAIEMINRLLLLLFFVIILTLSVLFALAGTHVASAHAALRQALSVSFRTLRRAPWELMWRALVFVLVLYFTYEVAGNITFSFGTTTFQSVVSVFFIPFSLFFARQLYDAYAVRRVQDS